MKEKKPPTANQLSELGRLKKENARLLNQVVMKVGAFKPLGRNDFTGGIRFGNLKNRFGEIKVL